MALFHNEKLSIFINRKSRAIKNWAVCKQYVLGLPSAIPLYAYTLFQTEKHTSTNVILTQSHLHILFALLIIKFPPLKMGIQGTT